MSSRRHKMKNKSVIKKKHFTKPNNFPIKKKIISFISSFNYNSIIKDIFNRLLYFFFNFFSLSNYFCFYVACTVKGKLTCCKYYKYTFYICFKLNGICKNHVLEDELGVIC